MIKGLKVLARVLVVCSHPDDEIIGLGGTIKKKVLAGDEVRCLILGEGMTSRKDKREDTESEVLTLLQKQTLNAKKIIGYKEVIFSNLPDNRFDRIDLLDIVKIIEKEIIKFKPEIIYTHHYGDLNIDHQISFKAVLTATRPIGNYCVKEIYAFETYSSTEWNFQYNNCFKPNVFVDVEQTFKDKINAMKCYNTELCEFPHPRSIESLKLNAKRWGSVVGKNYVEAFELIRKVVF